MGLEVWKKYRNMLAVDFFDSKEMVIVERPLWTLCPNYHQHASNSGTVHELCANIFLFYFFRYYMDDNWVSRISLYIPVGKGRRAGVHVSD